jgi:hypothetical protein
MTSYIDARESRLIVSKMNDPKGDKRKGRKQQQEAVFRSMFPHLVPVVDGRQAPKENADHPTNQ